MSRVVLAVVLLLCVLAAGPSVAAPVRVLFIGNELIDAPAIPRRLADLAKAMGKDVEIEAAAFDSYTLYDHLRDDRTLALLDKRWNVVVLQQGPSAGPDERAQLIDSAKRFTERIRAQGATPALFMAWPPSDRLRDFPAAIESYRAAAEATGATLLPVAEAWLRLLSQDKRAALHSGRANASSLGGDLAVLTVWFGLFPAGPREFDDAYVAKIARALDIDPSRRELYLDAATRAIDEPLRLK
jgi:hypothetical protein